MWYEIVPCMAIITAAMILPNYGTYWMNKLFLGNQYRRDTRQIYDFQFLLRDYQLTGDGYKQQGLEGIPDKE